ncbi:MAG: murein biosynthesis integral membrane protein MurJ [Bauldia sp.]|nr:murein biosynthesis integral membrane protein MurJ [Bauldia sp.]
MSLLKNFATVGFATASSRVLGFVRDMFIAAAIGTGPVADAFIVAQRLPNLFRRLFAEGAFASAFVPLFTKSHENEGAEAARRFAEESLAALAAALLLLTIVAEIGMVWLTYALAPGFAAEPEKFDLAVFLSRIAFPYLLLISIVSLLSGALNGIGRFAAAAFAPALLNVVLIAVLVRIYWIGEIGTVDAGVQLTVAMVVGGVLQLGFLYYACGRAGLAFRLVLPRLTAGVRRLTRLAGPSIVAGGVVQINIVVGTVIASLQPGAVSWLYYADRLYQLPLGIVGIAIGVVLLPDLARADTRTPMRAGAVSMSVNVAAAFGFFFLFGPVGIAAATSLAAWVNTIQLWVRLGRRGHFTADASIRRRMPLLALASLLMGLAVWLAAWWMAPWLSGGPLIVRAGAMACLVAGGVAFFVAFCQLAGVVDFRRVFRRVPSAGRRAT